MEQAEGQDALRRWIKHILDNARAGATSRQIDDRSPQQQKFAEEHMRMEIDTSHKKVNTKSTALRRAKIRRVKSNGQNIPTFNPNERYTVMISGYVTLFVNWTFSVW